MGNNPITALLVIDVQQGQFNGSTPVYQADQVIQNILLLIERARQGGAPVIFIQHSTEKFFQMGSEDWQFHPNIQPAAGDLTIQKHHSSSFGGTSLQAELQARGVTRLVLCGLATQYCVKAASLAALKLGYQVILVQDAHSCDSPKAAELIQTWNEKLRTAGASLVPAQAVTFA